MNHRAIGDEIGTRQFWQALGRRPMGATVITAPGAKGPAGFLGLSFAHISSAPPKVLVAIGNSTSALETIRDSGQFAVNLLPPGRSETAKAFSGKAPMEDRFAPGQWGTLITGAPVLLDATAVFDCEVSSAIEDASAVIVVGHVRALEWDDRAGATTAWSGEYIDIEP
ncbi:flavin reductase family protein [Phaeobacter gallaeciensis]|uniref:Flavin reductase family protein n=1 Tax=Phaeobacter gallaeciensis TaxID=60890 RepID=A0ABD4XE11_9RHOB|nr:flavin reductase family protein [Phaeobacter gallaeciensis]MDE4142228.1 flavin reductase family protein [Phaeobacter gallaeciensis]MDE4146576.1 flavin reductase family protein [Phaeobacter gallaeciensis]MDE4150649.1 flavin reductase family protein [Phaeobacter gallaeciensis]MDE4154828.1 flavin reductase family protein [Phaeobacter gallaeciensis]MDE4159282.1 flavin reductase family protein [Phaeobacter gallaeciensis]